MRQGWRLFLLASGAAGVGTLAVLVMLIASSAILYEGSGVSRADLLGFSSLFFFSSFAIAAVFYVPGLLLVRKAAGPHAPAVDALVAAVPLNLPAAAALVIGLLAGRFGSLSEPALFALGYTIAGAVFGWAFAGRPAR
jgi:hypothetical protein